MAATPATAERLIRALRQPVALPLLDQPQSAAAQSALPLLVVDDGFAASEAVCAQLTACGFSVLHAGALANLAAAEVVNLDDESDIKRLGDLLAKQYGGLAGLLYLVDLAAAAPADAAMGRMPVALGRLLRLAKQLGPQLRAGRIFCVSRRPLLQAGRSDGTDAVAAETSAALAGALRSLGREWPQAQVRALSLPGELPLLRCAELVGAELLDTQPHSQIDYHGAARLAIEAPERPLPLVAASELLADLGPQSVVLVTGGARGITAAVAIELARRYRPTLVLVGRSPLPSPLELADTAGKQTLRELKAALFERRRRSGLAALLPTIEADYQTLLRERQIRTTLAELHACGAQVYYHAVDVSDPQAAAALVAQLYASHGRIDGLIHGAGVIEDARIEQKSVESAQRVYETKVRAAHGLLAALRPAELTFCAFFSSIVAHTGNAGQTDYAAANAALGQLSRSLDRQTPGRVVSILWGPWRGGMVRPELEEHLQQAGWALIEQAVGARACIDELRLGRKGDCEVLLTAPTPPAATVTGSGLGERRPGSASGSERLVVRLGQTACRRLADGALELPLTLDLRTDRYLGDHRIDGVPVLPLAGALSLFGEAAALACPGWHLGRIDHLALLSGVRLAEPTQPLLIRCRELPTTLAGERRRLGLELLGSGRDGKQRPHYRAQAELYSSLTALALATADLAQPPLISEGQPPLPLSQIYGRWLFHGPLFQGITAVTGFAQAGVAATLRGSRPADCLATAPTDATWLVDPILLDSAMQLAGIWARHFAGITVLPTGCQSLTRWGSPKGELCRGRVRVVPSPDEHELRCDIAVDDADGTPLLLMLGLCGVGSAALNRLGEQGPGRRQ